MTMTCRLEPLTPLMALAENKSREDTLTGNCTLANNNKHVVGKIEFIESSNQNGGTRHYASGKRPFGQRGFRWSPLATFTAEPARKSLGTMFVRS